jgi:hypothetical protein
VASSAWQRRNERARAEGFRNYYDKRTRGKVDAPKPTGETLRRARGHAGPSDLRRTLNSGKVELVNVVQTGYGKTPTFDVLVILSDGTQRTYTVKGSTAATRLRSELDGLGPDAPQVTGSPKGVKRFAGDDEDLEAEIAAAEAELEQGESGEPYTYDDTTPFD